MELSLILLNGRRGIRGLYLAIPFSQQILDKCSNKFQPSNLPFEDPFLSALCPCNFSVFTDFSHIVRISSLSSLRNWKLSLWKIFIYSNAMNYQNLHEKFPTLLSSRMITNLHLYLQRMNNWKMSSTQIFQIALPFHKRLSYKHSMKIVGVFPYSIWSPTKFSTAAFCRPFHIQLTLNHLYSTKAICDFNFSISFWDGY